MTIEVKYSREQPAKIRRGPEQRLAIAAWLRDLADSVARGDLEDLDPTAILVVLSDVDVHLATWQGYGLWQQLTDAIEDARSAVWKRRSGGTPEDLGERAARRRKLRDLDRAALEAELARRPYVCRCGGRFPTERGHAQHARQIERRGGAPSGMAAIFDNDGTSRGWIHVESAEQFGWSLAGWACPLPDPDAHALASVYSPPPATLRAIE